MAQESKSQANESKSDDDYSYVKNLPFQSRNIIAKEFKLCFSCYSKGHRAKECTEAQGKAKDQ